jgi:hypothetical protein
MLEKRLQILFIYLLLFPIISAQSATNLLTGSTVEATVAGNSVTLSDAESIVDSAINKNMNDA